MARLASAWLILLAFSSSPGLAADVDADGLDDAFEQALLNRFVPGFQVSRSDCDSLPAEFEEGSRHPIVKARNGVIYGRVSRRPGDALLEVQYYHLWGRDCGRLSHSLDVEHVSALIRAGHSGAPAAGWTALYWYAAAHEGTMCDASHVARASDIRAEDSGPTIWISDAKHASFLSRDLCQRGCGGDRCEQMTPLNPPRILNLGEHGAPMNGALWTASPRWGVGSKLKSDFGPTVVSRLEASAGAGVLLLKPSPAAPLVLAGNRTMESVELSNRKVEWGLAIADRQTESKVSGACAKVERSLKRSREAVGKFFRRGAKTAPPAEAAKNREAGKK